MTINRESLLSTTVFLFLSLLQLFVSNFSVFLLLLTPGAGLFINTCLALTLTAGGTVHILSFSVVITGGLFYAAVAQ